MYCADCTVSVPSTENAPAGSEHDLRRGTNLPVPEERGDVPTRGGFPGCGAGTGWGESGAGKFLMSSPSSIVLSAAEEGLAVWRDSQWGTKDRGEGFFQEPEFIHKMRVCRWDPALISFISTVVFPPSFSRPVRETFHIL